MKSICKTDLNGSKYWVIPNTENDDLSFLDYGILHRENGPAVEHIDSSKQWFINGKIHRENGPALEHKDGTKKWYINGVLHREDGPAVEYENGAKEWFYNGKIHRINGPAIESIDGSKYWYINGNRHREDGPAIEWCDGRINWYQNGRMKMPTNEIMEKYIRLNPDNILKDYYYPFEIQLLAINLKPSVIFNIKYPYSELKELYPQLYALKDSGLI